MLKLLCVQVQSLSLYYSMNCVKLSAHFPDLASVCTVCTDLEPTFHLIPGKGDSSIIGNITYAV